MIKMSLFDCVKEDFRVYPEVLGYYYATDIAEHPEKLEAINLHDFVFISSDYAMPIPGCEAHHVMTSAEEPGTYMWLQQDYTNMLTMPFSEWTDVPTVGFVGRCPVFDIPTETPDGRMGTVKTLHRGFEHRLGALEHLNKSDEICCDFHVRFAPAGDSAGFWNERHPDYKRHGPLFKTNMLANQYQVCARGNANWSLRFYETLANGRIPVYVESGGMTAADWYYGRLQDRLDDVPFVYVKDVEDIEWEVLKFHNTIDSMSEMQSMCRDWYFENYSPVAQWTAFQKKFAEYMK